VILARFGRSSVAFAVERLAGGCHGDSIADTRGTRTLTPG
jgi:hypothetical protein